MAVHKCSSLSHASTISLTSVPTPVNSALAADGIVDDLGQPLAGLLFSDVAPSDVFHEKGEDLSEPLPLLSEELGLGDAARIHGGEGDTGGLVVAAVELADGHHVHDLAVFVGLGAIVVLAVHHGDGLLASLLHALQLAEVRPGVNEPSSDSIRVAGDGPDDDAPGAFGLLQRRAKRVTWC